MAQNEDRGQWQASSASPTHTTSSGQDHGISRIVAVWRGLFQNVAPMGYEDETGFHYGDAPQDDQTT